MTDISVIILVGKEELHIKRCLERLAKLEPKQVFIVESQKGDATHDLAISIAHSLGWQADELKEGERPPLNTQYTSLAICCTSSTSSRGYQRSTLSGMIGQNSNPFNSTETRCQTSNLTSHVTYCNIGCDV